MRVRFGGITSDAIDEKLADAAMHYADAERAEASLLEARALDPSCLPVYFALYKFYFYQSRLQEAEAITLQALLASARQADIPEDWQQLSAHTIDWSDIRAPQHFYLFSLKALAFIRLRRGEADQANALLRKIEELDPRDSVGASVIRTLAAAAGKLDHA